jgi:hypothetical protein
MLLLLHLEVDNLNFSLVMVVIHVNLMLASSHLLC